MEDMQKAMLELNLHPLKGIGHKFTWTNKETRTDRVCLKIDHALGNFAWFNS